MRLKYSLKISILVFFLIPSTVFSQNTLQDLKAFEAGKNWKIVGDVTADLETDYKLVTEKGTGILVNLPEGKRISNLITKDEFGDVDVEIDFMMARHSNSGIYLMGRYEVQLLDSWGKKTPKYGDLGGIYQRRRKDGSQYEGHAPRANVSKAPGTWQRMKISFQAPRFNEQGEKISNAKMLKIELNGFIIHENVELTGPTGGPISEEEAPRGPLMIQGDHGPVAFRNLTITKYEDLDIPLTDIARTVYKGEIQPLLSFDWEGMKSSTNSIGQIDVLDISEELGWASIFKGKIIIPKQGSYTFRLQAGGASSMSVDGKVVVPKAWSRTNWDPRPGEAIELSQGVHSFELIYSKVDGWLPTGLGVFIESSELRRKPLHKGISPGMMSNGQPPVYLEAEVPKVVRSFMSVPDGNTEKVLTHVVNVGSPTNLHFTYDTSSGQLIKLWRGNFLNVSPMWNGRGNARAISMGAELWLNTSGFKNEQYKSLGYDINDEGYPIFRYQMAGEEIIDQFSTDGKIVTRTISGESLKGVRMVISTADSIEKLESGIYSINDKNYFIISDMPLTVTREGDKSVLSAVVVESEIKYSIIW